MELRLSSRSILFSNYVRSCERAEMVCSRELRGYFVTLRAWVRRGGCSSERGCGSSAYFVLKLQLRVSNFRDSSRKKRRNNKKNTYGNDTQRETLKRTHAGWLIVHRVWTDGLRILQSQTRSCPPSNGRYWQGHFPGPMVDTRSSGNVSEGEYNDIRSVSWILRNVAGPESLDTAIQLPITGSLHARTSRRFAR